MNMYIVIQGSGFHGYKKLFFSSSSSRWKYDVFLSFRGEDTRNRFADHLYSALKQKGIFTFRDDEELERGRPISLKLLKAIEESLFAIVILSKKLCILNMVFNWMNLLRSWNAEKGWG